MKIDAIAEVELQVVCSKSQELDMEPNELQKEVCVDNCNCIGASTTFLKAETTVKGEKIKRSTLYHV